jgi:cellulose synthase/poly-beta-1,6-N-acetylglucosamine synthase-like glycosyltransferase
VTVAELLFWSSTALIAYAYVGYPMALAFIRLVHKKVVNKADITPSVTFIITAYNEERRIGEKLDNTLKLNYPAALLEVIVASDCSSDRTDQLVRSYGDRGIKLVRADLRKGKEAAQKLAVGVAKGEIMVISDVATILQPDAIRNIVKSFNYPSVACVSSADRFVDQDGRTSGEGAYVKYEMFLRSLESTVYSLVGLSGSFFAARSSVCRQSWSEDLQSDFNTLLSSVRLGLRGVADPESVGYYHNLLDQRKEYERKVRTVVRGISVFMRSVSLLNPLRYHVFAWQLFSHKLCRWLVPFAMIAALVANGWLALSSPVYRVILLVQAGFYSLALVYMLSRRVPSIGMLRIPSFFVMANLSILDAWMRYFRGERIVSWTPSKR